MVLPQHAQIQSKGAAGGADGGAAGMAAGGATGICAGGAAAATCTAAGGAAGASTCAATGGAAGGAARSGAAGGDGAAGASDALIGSFKGSARAGAAGATSSGDVPLLPFGCARPSVRVCPDPLRGVSAAPFDSIRPGQATESPFGAPLVDKTSVLRTLAMVHEASKDRNRSQEVAGNALKSARRRADDAKPTSATRSSGEPSADES